MVSNRELGTGWLPVCGSRTEGTTGKAADRAGGGTKLAAGGGIGPGTLGARPAAGTAGQGVGRAGAAAGRHGGGSGQYFAGQAVIPVAWLAVGPLLASLVLSPLVTAASPAGSCC